MDIIIGMVSADRTDLSISVPPLLAVSDLIHKVKECSSFLIRHQVSAQKSTTGDNSSDAERALFHVQWCLHRRGHTSASAEAHC